MVLELPPLPYIAEKDSFPVPLLITPLRREYDWLNYPDFSPVNHYPLFFPLKNILYQTFIFPGEYWLEGFNLQDPATGAIWHDNYPDLTDHLYSLTMQEINYGSNSVDYYYHPLTYIGHSRIGETGERSELRFGRKVGKNFSAVVGALLMRGTEYQNYHNYEKQQGILKFKYQLHHFSIRGNVLHQYLRQGHQDSLPVIKVYDLGQINLTLWHFDFNYKYYDLYHHDNQSPVNTSGWSQKIHNFNLVFNALKTSKLNADLYGGVIALFNSNSIYRYQAGIKLNSEILPLFWLNLNSSLNSDTNYHINFSGLYRPHPRYSFYGGYLLKDYPYPMIDSLTSDEIPRFRSKAYIGCKYLSPRLSADIVAGYIFKSENSVFQENRWEDIDRDISYTAGVNLNLSLTNHLDFYGMFFKELNESGYAYLHYHHSFFKDDLTIHILPGVSAFNTEEFEYYPHLLLKAQILSFEMYWRVMVENQKSRYDYGFIWNITN
ncbi:MAG: hypothetical protein APR63_03010 [Desulfuromonas sp. SDB]|nr:MAG: hypothetical protein APR63_03010 [Desulfuromonas sp. SDB]